MISDVSRSNDRVDSRIRKVFPRIGETEHCLCLERLVVLQMPRQFLVDSLRTETQRQSDVVACGAYLDIPARFQVYHKLRQDVFLLSRDITGLLTLSAERTREEWIARTTTHPASNA